MKTTLTLHIWTEQLNRSVLGPKSLGSFENTETIVQRPEGRLHFEGPHSTTSYSPRIEAIFTGKTRNYHEVGLRLRNSEGVPFYPFIRILHLQIFRPQKAAIPPFRNPNLGRSHPLRLWSVSFPWLPISQWKCHYLFQSNSGISAQLISVNKYLSIFTTKWSIFKMTIKSK